MGAFDFEKLDVFDVAVNMVLRVDAIAESLPKGRSYMRDQLRRAANSVALNISPRALASSRPLTKHGSTESPSGQRPRLPPR